MTRVKEKNIEALMANDNIGSADFHIFNPELCVLQYIISFDKVISFSGAEERALFELLNQNSIKQRWH